MFATLATLLGLTAEPPEETAMWVLAALCGWVGFLAAFLWGWSRFHAALKQSRYPGVPADQLWMFEP